MNAVEGELDLAHDVSVDPGGRAHAQALAVAQVDEAGVAAGGLGDQLDDAVEHLREIDRRADRADDRVQRVALEPYALELCRQVAAAGHGSILPRVCTRSTCLRPKWWPQATLPGARATG
jgi:ATP-dependent exoDNAse (exonuclease V) alpha subunit